MVMLKTYKNYWKKINVLLRYIFYKFHNIYWQYGNELYRYQKIQYSKLMNIYTHNIIYIITVITN